MPGKNRVNVVVDDEAKGVLVSFQLEKKLTTRDEAVEELFKEFPRLRAKVKELEAKLEACKGQT